MILYTTYSEQNAGKKLSTSPEDLKPWRELPRTCSSEPKKNYSTKLLLHAMLMLF